MELIEENEDDFRREWRFDSWRLGDLDLCVLEENLGRINIEWRVHNELIEENEDDYGSEWRFDSWRLEEWRVHNELIEITHLQ